MNATRSPRHAARPARRTRRRPTDLSALLIGSLEERWRGYRSELKRCQKKYSEAAVHDLRVATRRLISMLDLLNQLHPDDGLQRTRRKLKKHLQMFSPLRDAQVQLLSIEPMLPSFPALQDFHDHLVKRERKLVKRLAEKVNAVKTGSMAKIMRATAEQLQALLQTPAMQREKHRVAMAAVEAAFNRVVERRGAIDPSDPTTIHRMRVAFKKFRYMVEALAPILPKASPRRLKAMNAFQGRMGDIQDSEVLLASVRTFALQKPVGLDTALIEACQELSRRRTALVEAFLPSADAVFTFWTPASRAHDTGR
jgi:CHAD domain-containing protein